MPGSAALNAVLDEEGFTRQSETLILVRRCRRARRRRPDAGVELSAQPTAEWLRLWWRVDGRGDGDPSPPPAESSKAAPRCTRW